MLDHSYLLVLTSTSMFTTGIASTLLKGLGLVAIYIFFKLYKKYARIMDVFILPFFSYCTLFFVCRFAWSMVVSQYIAYGVTFLLLLWYFTMQRKLHQAQVQSTVQSDSLEAKVNVTSTNASINLANPMVTNITATYTTNKIAPPRWQVWLSQWLFVTIGYSGITLLGMYITDYVPNFRVADITQHSALLTTLPQLVHTDLQQASFMGFMAYLDHLGGANYYVFLRDLTKAVVLFWIIVGLVVLNLFFQKVYATHPSNFKFFGYNWKGKTKH